MGAIGAGAKFGVMLPFSRKHESEADILGLEYMAKAAFDPKESIELWKNMNAMGGSKPMEIMSTHPSDETLGGNGRNQGKQQQLAVLLENGSVG